MVKIVTKKAAKRKKEHKLKTKNKKLLKQYWSLLYPLEMVERITIDRPQYDK